MSEPEKDEKLRQAIAKALASIPDSDPFRVVYALRAIAIRLDAKLLRVVAIWDMHR